MRKRRRFYNAIPFEELQAKLAALQQAAEVQAPDQTKKEKKPDLSFKALWKKWTVDKAAAKVIQENPELFEHVRAIQNASWKKVRIIDIVPNDGAWDFFLKELDLWNAGTSLRLTVRQGAYFYDDGAKGQTTALKKLLEGLKATPLAPSRGANGLSLRQETSSPHL